MKKYLYLPIALLTAAFGILTLFLSSSVLFDWFGIRAEEGHFVPVVVWANFFCSLIYLAAGYGIFRREKWAVHLLTVAAGVLILAFIGLMLHINSGGLYEKKTMFALPFRTGVTLLFTVGAYWVAKNWGGGGA
jgi:hypothetical protein